MYASTAVKAFESFVYKQWTGKQRVRIFPYLVCSLTMNWLLECPWRRAGRSSSGTSEFISYKWPNGYGHRLKTKRR